LENDIYYYSGTSGEADFLVCKGNKVIQIIQVSYDISDKKTLDREIKGLLLASAATKCDNLLLITDHEEREEVIKNKIITIVPAYSWLLKDSSTEESIVLI
ncbi:MAG: ATP-binding protein, partial [Spirochaetales bacterium]|nr:ATP-binding protein [Spirochaetales bacterium]